MRFSFRSLSSNYRTVTSITLIDFPGYQSGLDRKAGFGEFCFNYVNERVHAFYHDTVFQNQMDIYRQEKVQIDFQLPSMTPAVLVDLMDKPMQHHVVRYMIILVSPCLSRLFFRPNQLIWKLEAKKSADYCGFWTRNRYSQALRMNRLSKGFSCTTPKPVSIGYWDWEH